MLRQVISCDICERSSDEPESAIVFFGVSWNAGAYDSICPPGQKGVHDRHICGRCLQIIQRITPKDALNV